jgi:hypothetical protein
MKTSEGRESGRGSSERHYILRGEAEKISGFEGC